MSLPQFMLEAAAGEVGVTELGGNNRGARIEDYQRATWLPTGPWPWCAAFMAWSLARALVRIGVEPARADAWRCRDGSAFGWISWAKRAKGCLVLVPGLPPQPGDIAVFDFNGPTAAGGGHIGIVERADDWQSFTTIEGNTGSAGLRETQDGKDGVFRKTRSGKSAVNFIRLPEYAR